MKPHVLTAAVIVGLSGLAGSGASAQEEGMKYHWDLDMLTRAPATFPVPDETIQDMVKEKGASPEHFTTGDRVRPLFYEGLPWHGEPTRVFAWYGVPDHAEGERVPAMVLAHGGGGTAFDEWVRVWNRRGYAAIAMDLTGARPGGKPGERPRHAQGGPPHLGDNRDVDEAPEEQWVYHAVADIVLAHSLLRSFPEVDPDRIGLTGISWGGFLSCITAAVDSRFAFAVPVYGCGLLKFSPAWQTTWQAMGADRAQRWYDLWDPINYVDDIAIPTLWVNGSNDSHFTMNIHGKCFESCGGDKTLSILVPMAHSHVHGWKPESIYAYADACVKDGTPFIEIVEQGRDEAAAWARFQGERKPVGAKLVYTTDPKDWVACEWPSVDAAIDKERGTISAPLPEGWRVYFFNLVDADGLTVSSLRVIQGDDGME
ncbi:MAG: prolyl oligopeptidase family serine peptidase [bacterium]|nr:prolyl oligopeptidase family serine peptidase [bacterium]